jgi:aldose 1-epimerase
VTNSGGNNGSSNGNLVVLQNDYWQVGILPETGASLAFGRVKVGEWVDVLRPTAESDYGNASNCSSFIMAPWCNRIRDSRFRFGGTEYTLTPTNPDGTAAHGVVRRLPWELAMARSTYALLHFDSSKYENVNFPFGFILNASFHLSGRDFKLWLHMVSRDDRPFPAGIGHHPYFVRREGVQVQIPCDKQFELVNALAVGAPVPITPHSDFRELRTLDALQHDDLLTGRKGNDPARIVYPNVSLSLRAGSLYPHWLLFSPQGKPFFAIEPMSNANDGFNLYDRGVDGTGVFQLDPGEEVEETFSIRVDG